MKIDIYSQENYYAEEQVNFIYKGGFWRISAASQLSSCIQAYSIFFTDGLQGS